MCLPYCNMIWGLSIIIILVSNCLSATSTDTDSENAKNKKKHEICSLSLLVGGNKCKSPPERRFFYNKDVKCVQFDYTGCDGNENNFKTMEDCKQMCEDHDHSLHEHQNQNQTAKTSNDNQALILGATTTTTAPRPIQNSAKGILDAKYVGFFTGVNIFISVVTVKLLL